MSIEPDPARQDGVGGSSQDGEPPGIGHNQPPGGLLDDYLTRPEMAKALKIGERTLAQYDAMGEGPPRAFLAGRWIYHKPKAREWLHSRLTTEPSP
jgi:hypothetical protein